jgi:hypothetical protein
MAKDGSAKEDLQELKQASQTILRRISLTLIIILLIAFVFHWGTVSFRKTDPTPWYSNSLWDAGFMVKDDLLVISTCPTKGWNWSGFLIRTSRHEVSHTNYVDGEKLDTTHIDLRGDNFQRQICALNYAD